MVLAVVSSHICLHPGLGKVPTCFVDKTFWCIVTLLGQLKHRLMKLYETYPYRLAKLVSAEESQQTKIDVANAFLNLPECCLSSAFTKPLRRRVRTIDELLPGGKYEGLLRGAFQGLPCNVSVEDNFARIKSMQKTGRGRRDFNYTLCGKHLLSEVKNAHLEREPTQHP